jgi:vacuolar-type H+-ATPase subunit E/Vma4
MPETFFDTMAARVAEECAAEQADARREADRIIAATQERARERHEDVIAQTRADLASEAERAREIARAEAERAELAMRHTVAEEILERARQELLRMAAGDAFQPVIEALLAEVLQEAEDGMVVQVPKAQLDHCRRWLAGNGLARFTVEESRELVDGVAVQDRAQTYRISNTLSTRFVKLESAARKHCQERIFGARSE